MEKRFYESVDIPEEYARAYDRIFYLRNLFQEPELYAKEMEQLEKELTETLPVLDEPVGEIENYDAKDFANGGLEELFKDDVRPVVIRGHGIDHDSVKLWSPDFFKEKYGDFKIFFTSTEKIVNDEGTKLSDFVEQIVAGNKNRAYIENMSDIFNQYPELHDHLGVEKVEDYWQGFASYHRIAQLFFGGLGTGAVFHCARELNCFFNIYGRKKWTFLHPKYSVAMAATLMNKGYFVGSFVKHRSPQAFIEANTPLYNRVPRLSIVLEPGDILVNPPWWWHAIDNETPATIAVATRWQIEQEVVRQNPCYDFVESMRMNRLSSYGNDVKKGSVVVSDSQLRKNYVSYEQMGWKAKN